MKAIQTLKLVNKEADNIFIRTVGQEQLFMILVMSRINNLIHDCLFGKAAALIETYKINQRINDMADYFYDEIDKFEGLLERRNGLEHKKVKFISQHTHEMSVSSELSINISNLIEVFDKLISTIKLVHLSGGFDCLHSFYATKQRAQKKLNRLLSTIMQSKSTKDAQMNVSDILKNNSDQLFEIPSKKDIDILIKAMNTSYGPGLSKHIKAQITFRLKQLKKTDNEINSQMKEAI